MQRISKFPACCHCLDMSLLTRSRRQRYSKILRLQNNLKGNILEPLQQEVAEGAFKEC